MAQYKKEAYDQALQFRRRGFTYSEIAKICNVSKATVSNWLRHESFSQAVATDNKKRAIADNTKRLALINKTRVTERKSQYADVLAVAEREYKHYQHIPLFNLGLGVYLAKGDKKRQSLRLASSEVEVVKLFVTFVREFLITDPSDLKIWLLLPTEADVSTEMKYWSRKLSLSPAYFHKTQISSLISSKNAHGIATLVVNKQIIVRKLYHWIWLIKKGIK